MTNVQEWVQKPENHQYVGCHVFSHTLQKTVMLPELANINIDDLRSLYHEIVGDRDSMLRAVTDFKGKLEDEANASNDYLHNKFKKLLKKLNIYNTFSRLIKREINWRLAINAVSRAKFAIRAKEAGITETQIAVLLDPENESPSILIECMNPHSTKQRKIATIAQRIDSLKSEMFMSEFCKLMSTEFDSTEIEEIKKEAMDRVEKVINWPELHSMLKEHMPDENGTVKL